MVMLAQPALVGPLVFPWPILGPLSTFGENTYSFQIDDIINPTPTVQKIILFLSVSKMTLSCYHQFPTTKLPTLILSPHLGYALLTHQNLTPQLPRETRSHRAETSSMLPYLKNLYPSISLFSPGEARGDCLQEKNKNTYEWSSKLLLSA